MKGKRVEQEINDSLSRKLLDYFENNVLLFIYSKIINEVVCCEILMKTLTKSFVKIYLTFILINRNVETFPI